MTRARSLVSWVFLASGVLMIAAGALRRQAPEGSWSASRTLSESLWIVGIVFVVVAIVLRRAAPRADVAAFLSVEDEKRVIAAIADIEKTTAGEVRVHLATRSKVDVLIAARETFEKLGMTATAARNGVLFFVDVGRRQLAVIGDTGIHTRVEEGFWDVVAREVESEFRKGRHADGLVQGLARVGARLAEHFPPRSGDVDELPNSLSRDDA